MARPVSRLFFFYLETIENENQSRSEPITLLVRNTTELLSFSLPCRLNVGLKNRSSGLISLQYLHSLMIQSDENALSFM